MDTSRLNGGDPYFGGFIGRTSAPPDVPSKEIVQIVRGELGAAASTTTPSRATPSQSSNACTPYAFLVMEAEERSRFELGALVWANKNTTGKRKQHDDLLSTEELTKRVWERYTGPGGIYAALSNKEKGENAKLQQDLLEMKPFSHSFGSKQLEPEPSSVLKFYKYECPLGSTCSRYTINGGSGFFSLTLDDPKETNKIRGGIFKLLDEHHLKARPAAIVAVTPTKGPTICLTEQYDTVIQGPCLTNQWSGVDLFAGDRVYMCVLADVACTVRSGSIVPDKVFLRGLHKSAYVRRSCKRDQTLDTNTFKDIYVTMTNIRLIPATSRTLTELPNTNAFRDKNCLKVKKKSQEIYYQTGRLVVGAWEIGKVVDGDVVKGAACLENIDNPKTTSTVNVDIKWVSGDMLNDRYS